MSGLVILRKKVPNCPPGTTLREESDDPCMDSYWVCKPLNKRRVLILEDIDEEDDYDQLF